MPDKKAVFVVGADDYNLDMMRRIPQASEWNLIPVLGWEDVQPSDGRIDFDELYKAATQIIEGHDREPDAIIGYLDFPVTALVSLLSRDFGRPYATPEAVARCEHKYWMRLHQKKLFPDETPRSVPVNPFNPGEAKRTVPEYPFWLKPVKSHSSVLGFMIENEGELDEALHECRQRIHFIGEPFNQFLAHLSHPNDEAAEIDGNYAVAEELVSAPRQFTLEGYVLEGDAVVYGVIESLRQGQYKSSFSQYRYPAEIDENVIKKAIRITVALLQELGYDNAPFNIEFFWDEESDKLSILELNARLSKSHAPLFDMVDGAAHFKVPVDLSLGRKPEGPYRQGKDAVAAKFMLRSFEADGLVERMPTTEEIDGLKSLLPDLSVQLLVDPNTRLSTLAYQDSYSYELADVFIGGDNWQMVEDVYARCVDSLPILIKPLPKMARRTP